MKEEKYKWQTKIDLEVLRLSNKDLLFEVLEAASGNEYGEFYRQDGELSKRGQYKSNALTNELFIRLDDWLKVEK